MEKIKAGRFQGRSVAQVVRYAPDWVVEWYIPAMSGHDEEAVAEAEYWLCYRATVSLEEYDASIPLRY